MKRTRICLVLALVAGLVLPLIGSVSPSSATAQGWQAPSYIPSPAVSSATRFHRLYQITHQEYEEGWMDSHRWQIGYTPQNHYSSVNFQEYQDGEYQDMFRYLYSYRADGQIESISSVAGEEPNLVVYETTTFEYENDRLIHVVHHNVDNPYSNRKEKNYTYDDSTGKVQRIEYLYWESEDLLFFGERLEFEWDYRGRPSRIHVTTKQPSLDWTYTHYEQIEWMLNDASTYEDYIESLNSEWYNLIPFGGRGTNFLVHQITTVHRTGTSFDPRYKRVFIYDFQDRVSQQLIYSWTLNGWINEWTAGYSYAANGSLDTLDFYRIENGVQHFDYRLIHLFQEVMANEDGLAPSAISSLSTSPNPFSTTAEIRYELKDGGFTELEIYNLKGQLVRRLVAAQKAAGLHQDSWNGLDERGAPVGSGQYFLVLKTSGSYRSTKILLLR